VAREGNWKIEEKREGKRKDENRRWG